MEPAETETEAETDDDPDKKRGNWGNQIEFLLSCLSFAVGLGNIWRFPYLCYRNGGGAFLIPYTICIFITGIPIFFFELALGQFGSQSPVGIWNVVPLFKGIGWCMFFISVGIGLYYNVIIAWTLYFLGDTFLSLFRGESLPWVECNNAWNDENCISLNVSATAIEHRNESESAAQQYFQRKVLQISDGFDNHGELRTELVVTLLLAWLIVALVLTRGVKSIGKAVYVTAIFPYVILLVMFVRGVCLEGASDGIYFYITPRWEKLLEIQVWADAAMQIFFSLGPCWGGLITLASYNKFNNNCFRDAVIVACSNCVTSLFAGFVVFSFVGFMAYELDKDISEVVEKGPGLAFIVYPNALSLLPAPFLWAILFFLMLLMLGFGTQFSLLETMVCIICDTWPRAKRRYVLPITCLLMFFIGLSMVTNGGMYVLQLMDDFAGTYNALICGCFEILVLAWIYGVDRFLIDIQTMFQWNESTWRYRAFEHVWHYMWKAVTPLVCAAILIGSLLDRKPLRYDSYVYPNWANSIGWCVSFFSASMIPLGVAFKLYKESGTFKERLAKLTKPSKSWGPRLKADRDLAKKKWRENGFVMDGDESEGPKQRIALLNDGD